MRVSENIVLRRIFGTEREEITGGWRKLHNEILLRKCVLLTKYYAAQIKEEMSWACRRGMSSCKILSENLKGSRYSERIVLLV